MEGGLRRDEDWRPLDGYACRVIQFTALAGRVEGGEVKSFSKSDPYASIEIESSQLAEPTTGFVTHKDDFRNLWYVFNVRGVADDEEVIVFWRKSALKGAARSMSRTMPGLQICVYPKHAYELMADPNFPPELDPMERIEGQVPPIEMWVPEVLGYG